MINSFSNTHSVKQGRRVAVGTAVVLLLTATVVVVRNRHVFRPFPKRFTAVEPGVLYRSGQPTRRQVENLVEKYGIRTILIVRKGHSRRLPTEMALGRELGLNMVRIPIESNGTVSDDQVEAFFRCVDNPRNQPVLVHCSAGRHRTGYLCALYRIERQGWTVEDAMDEMLSFGFSIERHGDVLEQLRRYEPVRASSPTTRPALPVSPVAEVIP